MPGFVREGTAGAGQEAASLLGSGAFPPFLFRQCRGPAAVLTWVSSAAPPRWFPGGPGAPGSFLEREHKSPPSPSSFLTKWPVSQLDPKGLIAFISTSLLAEGYNQTFTKVEFPR